MPNETFQQEKSSSRESFVLTGLFLSRLYIKKNLI
jgi:hypothetical protein